MVGFPAVVSHSCSRQRTTAHHMEHEKSTHRVCTRKHQASRAMAKNEKNTQSDDPLWCVKSPGGRGIISRIKYCAARRSSKKIKTEEFFMCNSGGTIMSKKNGMTGGGGNQPPRHIHIAVYPLLITEGVCLVCIFSTTQGAPSTHTHRAHTYPAVDL